MQINVRERAFLEVIFTMETFPRQDGNLSKKLTIPIKLQISAPEANT